MNNYNIVIGQRSQGRTNRLIEIAIEEFLKNGKKTIFIKPRSANEQKKRG